MMVYLPRNLYCQYF